MIEDVDNIMDDRSSHDELNVLLRQGTFPVQNNDPLLKSLQHQLLATKNESEMEKGLLRQKLDNLESINSELKQKEVNLAKELKDQRYAYLNKLKEKEADYETKFEELRENYEKAQERIVELESNIEEVRQISDWEKQRRIEVENQIRDSK